MPIFSQAVKIPVNLTFWPAASKYDGLNGDSLWRFPLRVDDGTLAGRRAETRVGMSARFSFTQRKKRQWFNFSHFDICMLSETDGQ